MTAEFRRLAALLLLSATSTLAQANPGPDFCAIYPIAVPQAALTGKQPGAIVAQLPRGSGSGNFSWLTWAGGNDAPSLANSLVPPGDSDTYVNPGNASDHRLDLGDWAQGAPGSMNAKSVRERLDALKTQDIIVPAWSAVRGQGGQFDYRVQRFVTIRLRDYQLNGQGWLSFEYKGDAICYNQPPTALPQSLFTDEDTALPLTLTGSDPESDALSFRVVDAPEHGSLSGDAPNLVYTPDADYHGADGFTFTVKDSQYESAPARIELTVRPVNDAPAADGQTLTTDEDLSLPITLTGSDIDGDALTFTVVGAPQLGTLSGTAPDLIYTPGANFNGEDGFTFKSNDGSLDSAAASVAITVRPVNDAPTAAPQSLETREGSPLPMTLSGSDIDGDTLNYRVLAGPLHGSLTGDAPTLIYTPAPGYFGADSFDFIARDAELDSDAAKVEINVLHINRAPTITSTPPASVSEGATYAYDVDAIDPDADVLLHRLLVAPDNGSIVESSGQISWPEAGHQIGSLRNRNLMCKRPQPAISVDPMEMWAWTGSAVEPDFNQVIVTPFVAPLHDSNEDGRVDQLDTPQVIVTTHSRLNRAGGGIIPGRLRVLDGRSGAEVFTTSAQFAVDGFATPAVGDITGDGVAEIIAPAANGGVIAFRSDGSVLWATQALSWATPHTRSTALADLDGDGAVEIIVGDIVLDSSGKQLWRLSMYRGASRTDLNGIPSVVDIDGDGKLEIIAGASAYASDGSIKWSNPSVGDGYTAVADFDLDGVPEIVVVRSGVWLIRSSGQVVWGPVALPGGGEGGPPTVGDFDGDGRPEIGVAGRGSYTSFDGDGRVLWSSPTQDGTSRITGSTLFDLDGDDRVEVLYNDERHFRIFDGATGAIRYQVRSTSGTINEYPVVADIDLDGHAEILVASNEFMQLTGRDSPPGTTGVRAYKATSGGWMPTRSIWNQHAYYIDNINDDGTVPSHLAKSWLTHNTFRLNTFPDRHPLGLADLALFDLRLDENDGTAIKVLVTNRGLAPTESASAVRIYNGDPTAGGSLLGTLEVPALAAGEQLTLSLSGLAPDVVDSDLYAQVDEAGEVAECDDGNNGTAAAYFAVRATDSGGLYDTQRFTVTVEAVNRAPTFLTTALPAAQTGRDYRFVIEASDANVGDGLRFELIDAPIGLQIEAVSGELRWNPLSTQAGTHTVVVRVTDLGGLSAQRSLVLNVVANHPPVIVSEPVLDNMVGREYRYAVVADDEDGDALNYRLDAAPAGMEIDAVTGVISWLPAAEQVGEQAVAIVVEDGLGGSDRQSFVVVVGTAPVNQSPTITSTPPASLEERTTYRYDVDAIDPDVGDVLSHRLDKAPGGAGLEGSSGLIEWLADGRYAQGLRSNNLACRAGSTQDVLDPVVKWHWQSSQIEPTYNQVMVSPIVVQANDDNGDEVINSLDYPDVVVVTHAVGRKGSDGMIRVLSGVDGTELYAFTGASRRVTDFSSVAAGDIDGDGVVEIIGIAMDGSLLAFEHDGTLKWKATAPGIGWNVGTPAIADLNGDGRPEILYGKYVYNAEGVRQWVGTGAYAGSSTGVAGPRSVAVDLHPEPGQEVLAGPSLYSANGALLWSYSGVGDGYTAVGDMDRDGQPEVVLVANGKVVALAADGRVKWGPVLLSGGGVGGPPTLADMDGDGKLEVGVASSNYFYAFDHQGSLVWKRAVVDVSSSETGSSVFDFDGDGRVEVVHQDEHTFRIFDGATGNVKFELPNETGTSTEYPVVADVDRDGSADILLVSNRFWGGTQTGVRLISSASKRWMPTRSIWNQHAYHIDNINDDGTVPSHPSKSWLTHNTFRLNTFPDRHPLGLADLALFDLRLEEGTSTAVKVLVVNRGLAPTSKATVVRFFNGDPGAGGTLIGSRDVPVLAAGEEMTLSLDDLLANVISTNLYARIDEGNTVAECLDDNNDTAAAYFAVRATDAGGLYDSQRFTVTVENVNEAPLIESMPLPIATVEGDYRYSIHASDPDRGDGLRFELLNPPSGLSIEAVSGELRWKPSASQVGNHDVTVRVTDLGGLSVERSITLSVSTNHSPEITSTPLTDADAGHEYSYAPQASDADGDALRFSLTLAPDGMVIDAVSGLINWTPKAGSSGVYEVEVRVDDMRGGFALQRYSITLKTPENNAPKITSVPVVTALTGSLYSYTVDASDADGDTLTIVLKQAPTGMTLNEFSGELQWVPDSVQLGAQAVSVEVNDGRGGSATQNFDVVVSVAPVNHAPTITSTPSHQGKASHAYGYAATGFDADGDAITWSLTEAPAGMTVDPATGLLQWTPSAAGDYAVTLRAADAHAFADQSWTLTVVAADVALSGTIIITPQPLDPGATMTVSLQVAGAAGPVTVAATLDGQAISVSAGGDSSMLAPDAPGTHTLVAVISDGSDSVTVTQVFTVRDPADQSAPVVKLVLPAEHPDYDAVEVTAPAPVTGFVTGADVTQWLLGVRAAGESQVKLLAQGVGEFNEREIARFDPTLLRNGLYTLVLQAQDASGHVASDSRMVRVTGDMKLGQYSITFEEVSIPVAGIPVTVTRTYDTRRAQESLDFGYGWTVDYRSVRLQESRRPGYGWDVYNQGGTFGQTCIRPMGDPIVMVTLPDGETASFKAMASPECRSVFDGDAHVQLVFEAVDGGDYTLEQTDYGLLRWANVQGSPVPVLFDEGSDSTEPADPQHYQLTTPAGLVYALDQGFGIRTVTEPATGATLTYSSAGVKHSSGVGIDFIRDAAGRITMMKLPDGNVIEYGYTPSGDLDIVLDQAKEITGFAYAPQMAHYLQDIVDPRGVRVARNEYDDDGRLVAIIDADGHRTEYDHAISERTERVKDRNGHTTTYLYDDKGRVLFETNALGETIARTYDADGNTLTQTDPLGRTLSWSYDARGNRLSETNAAGETTTSTYNSKNQLLSQTDASGAVVSSNAYDSRTGTLLTATTDALGNVTSFGYLGGTGLFGTGQLGAISDASGATTAFTYSHEGYKASETDALGHAVRYGYDSAGRVTSEQRTRTVNGASETLTTRYRFDAKGRLLETTLPDGSTTTAEYAGLDQPVKTCDALNRCTRTEYDARGNVQRIVHPDGSTQTKDYDGNGNVIAETDGNGATTRFVFDAANRLIETIFPDATPANDADNPRSRSRYDAAGQLVESIDENGHSTRYVYDAAGRRTQTSLPLVGAASAATLTTEYDQTGRRLASIDPNGQRTAYRYDAAGRLIETVHPDATTTRTEYDAVGRKTADQDAQGRITRYGYDALGRLAIVVLPNPHTGANPPLQNGDSPDAGTGVTRYHYDEAGNKREQIDAEGRITRWDYDSMGREIARVLPEGQRETKAYDEAGQLLSSTDFNGNTTRYRYDANGRLTTIDYPHDADVEFVYDRTGNRIEARDGRGTSTRRYDARGRLVALNDADGGALAYEYDPAGNLQARISASQSLVYTYDARNRITTVTRSVDGEAPNTTTYGYDAAGNRTTMIGGDGIQTEYRYDLKNRLANLTKRTAAGILLAAMNYSVDASGLRTGVEEFDAVGPTRTVSYRYDGVKRLTEEAIGHRDASKDRLSRWTYDAVGNRLTQTVAIGNGPVDTTAYTYDGNDRLITETANASTTTYRYDDNGNTLSKSGAGQSVSYRYDDGNHLIEAITAEATIGYTYDADGLRTRQTVTPANGPATTTWYVHDSAYPYAQVVEQYTAEGNNPKRLSATFTFADELVSQTRYDAQGTPTTAFVLADGFGSTRWISDAAGNVTDSIDYDAFGVEIARSGTTNVAHLYRGERWDANVAAYDLRARLYLPGNGRFLTQDTFAGFGQDPQSLHKYTFNQNDPINRVDPSGHVSLIEEMATINTSTLMMVGARVVGAGAGILIGQRIGNIVSSREAAKTCAAKYSAGLRAFSNGDCPDVRMPIVFMSEALMPGIGEHVAESQAMGSPAVLNRTALVKSTNRGVALAKCALGMDIPVQNGGSSCDEYPFASTYQGGIGSTVAKVQLLSNWIQGGVLSGFYSACMVTPDVFPTNEFLVVPVASAPGTNFQCRFFGSR